MKLRAMIFGGILVGSLFSGGGYATSYNAIALPVPMSPFPSATLEYGVSDKGAVFWCGGGVDGGDVSPLIPDQIYRYSQGETVQITGSDLYKSLLKVNGAGQAIWQEGISLDATAHALMFYDGTTVSQISQLNIGERVLAFTDSGSIFWIAQDDVGINQLFVFHNGQIHALGVAPQRTEYSVNEQGQIAWIANQEVMWFDGNQVTQITNDDRDDARIEMNAVGTLMWTSADVTNASSRLMAYMDGSLITVASSNGIEPSHYSYLLGDHGEAFWSVHSGNEIGNDLFTFDGSQVHQLASGAVYSYADLNAKGELAYVTEGDFSTINYFYQGGMYSIVDGQSLVLYMDVLNDGSMMLSLLNMLNMQPHISGRLVDGVFYTVAPEADISDMGSLWTSGGIYNENGQAAWWGYANMASQSLFLFDGKETAEWTVSDVSMTLDVLLSQSGDVIAPVWHFSKAAPTLYLLQPMP